MKKNNPTTTWSEILGPAGGSVSCLAVIEAETPIILVGSQIGIFYQPRDNAEGAAPWTRLKSAPVGILSLAVTTDSPFRTTILAGTTEGVFVSQDLGNTWISARLPLSSSTILTLAVSPNFPEDRLALAGTLEDGIFYTNNGGRRWQSQSFGMLDASVFSIAISPSFVQDGTVFIGTESGIYYSYNHALAWKRLDFPEELSPVLSLAVSPGYELDHLLFAGTESHGLYASTDRGETWQEAGLPARCVNALHFTASGDLLAATDLGVFSSIQPSGEWTCQVNLPSALALTSGEGMNIAGFMENGAWLQKIDTSTPLDMPWQPVDGLNLRGFTRLLLSQNFNEDRTAYLASPQEGIWCSCDGGASWDDLTASYPGETINYLNILPTPQHKGLLISSDNGLWMNQSGSDQWSTLTTDPCTWFAFSHAGKMITAVFPGTGVRRLSLAGWQLPGGFSDQEVQQSWQSIPGPWDKGGEVLAFACQKDGTIHSAILEGIGESLSLWQGQPGDIEKVHSQPAGENPLVFVWLPPEPAPDRPWYASLGERIWKFSSRRAGVSSELPLFEEEKGEPIVGLNGAQLEGKIHLFACTGRGVYGSTDGAPWRQLHEFGENRAIDFLLSPVFSEDRIAYALLLGGSIAQIELQI